jgi:hypothetical protein
MKHNSKRALACSRKLDPGAMTVSTARDSGKEARREAKATQSGTDHRQAP